MDVYLIFFFFNILRTCLAINMNAGFKNQKL
jgi:hypothetical protein